MRSKQVSPGFTWARRGTRDFMYLELVLEACACVIVWDGQEEETVGGSLQLPLLEIHSDQHQQKAPTLQCLSRPGIVVCAANTDRVRTSLCANSSDATRVEVLLPEVVRATQRVLLLEYFDGLRLNNRAALDAHGVDRQRLVEVICRAYARQIYVDGFFNADPHPGNFLGELSKTKTLSLFGGVVRSLPAYTFARLSSFLSFGPPSWPERASAAVRCSVEGPSPRSHPARLRADQDAAPGHEGRPRQTAPRRGRGQPCCNMPCCEFDEGTQFLLFYSILKLRVVKRRNVIQGQ